MKSIGTKITLLYIFLALVNTLFFSIMIFDKQMGLITENTKYKAKGLAENIFNMVNLNAGDVNDRTLTEQELFDEIKSVLNESLKEYMIISDKGKSIYQSLAGIKLPENVMNDAITAISNKDNMGQLYYSTINEDTYEIHFYIPLTIYKVIDDKLLYFKFKMKNLDDQRNSLYKMIAFIIAVIALVHIIFGFFLNRIIIIPIKSLHNQSNKISDGEYSARVELKNKDEIGALGVSFNKMALSIEDKINKLDLQNRKMQHELKVAGEVQMKIYPELRETEFFKLAVFHKPLEEVSGDYHDFFQITKNKYGILLCDVCGHGVPAALITMRIQELFRKSIRKFHDTKDLYVHVNTELKDLMPRYNTYFTSFYIIVDQNKIIFTNAGHPDLYLVKHKTGKIYYLTTKGFMIGMTDTINYLFESKQGIIEPKDKIVMFSDGILEAKNVDDEMYDADGRLLKIINDNKHLGCEGLLDTIMDDVHAFTHGAEANDDKTLIIIEKK